VSSVLDVDGVSVSFRIAGRSASGRRGVLQAVKDVSLSIPAHQTVALVGESGSGKSTLARVAAGLHRPTTGVVRFADKDINRIPRRELRSLRARLQMVFQDPYSSLDPSMRVGDIVAEPLLIHTELSKQARREEAERTIAQVGLDASLLSRYPRQLSGGQRQRIAIARAIICDPALVICDEAVSALDVSTQSQVVNLLRRIQRERGLSYLFISHDMSIVRHMGDRIAVMYLGSIVEEGPAERVYNQPAHPYTVDLLAAVPRTHPGAVRPAARERGFGEQPDPLEVLQGCSFRTRCVHAMPICAAIAPPAVEVPGGGTAACHLFTQAPHAVIVAPAQPELATKRKDIS
jgi:oligopeptide/dipeptide ABC transporter ATP-binding protein